MNGFDNPPLSKFPGAIVDESLAAVFIKIGVVSFANFVYCYHVMMLLLSLTVLQIIRTMFQIYTNLSLDFSSLHVTPSVSVNVKSSIFMSRSHVSFQVLLPFWQIFSNLILLGIKSTWCLIRWFWSFRWLRCDIFYAIEWRSQCSCILIHRLTIHWWYQYVCIRKHATIPLDNVRS
jgi:hypothetical protein